MTRQQQQPSSDYDALFARDTMSFLVFDRRLLGPCRMCPVAIISLVSGLIAWIAIPIIGAVVAIIFGHVARRRIRRSEGMFAGDRMAIAGLFFGYTQIFIVLLLIGIAHLPPPIG